MLARHEKQTVAENVVAALSHERANGGGNVGLRQIHEARLNQVCPQVAAEFQDEFLEHVVGFGQNRAVREDNDASLMALAFRLTGRLRHDSALI
jgi:hypothetical protein